MPPALITGASGFLGRHLLAHLEGDWIAVGRRRPPWVEAKAYRECDLLDRAGLETLVLETAPAVVFHLAGRTPPGGAEVFYRSNTLATLHLLDALRAAARPCRVVLVGSAAELGPVPGEALPVGEDYPCSPDGPYGLSKWLMTCAGLAARPPLEVVVARVFNPIGPGLPASQALGRFAAELAGGAGPIRLEVGDLDARRDFVDARDVARALIALANLGRAGRLYHVGTGRSRSIREGLDELIRRSGREVTVDVVQALARPRGPSDSRADVGRIFEEAGWSAEISWEQSLDDLWADASGEPRSLS